MSLIRLQRNFIKRISVHKNQYSTASTTNLDDEEYTSTPNYPPILDLSPEKVEERKQEAVYDEVKSVKTIEEKQIKLNMPKYYGFKCYMYDEKIVPYGQLSLVQYLTRTHLRIQDNLPEYYTKINVDEILKDVKSELEETLLIEYNHCRRKYEILNENLEKFEKEKLFTQSLVQSINRILLNNISKSNSELKDIQVDLNPRIESFWFVGGMMPPRSVKAYRRSIPWLKDKENDPINRAIQYTGQPILNLRSRLPLLPIIPHGEANNTDFTVPEFKYDPRTVGTTAIHRHATNIPGFWPGDSHEHGLLSYLDRSHLLKRDYNDPLEFKETFHRQGILACFGWLNAQANYFGFTTFNDVTYPLVTQSVITNGQTWSFYVYQLNTILNHTKFVDKNDKKNICWAIPELKLFEEIKDRKLIGLNENVLKMLIQYYANAPEERLGVNMKPYLDQQYQRSAEYEDDDKRQWLEREYKFLMSNRPRHKEFYEIYHWEKIYKIDHKTRPMDPRRRPFELFQKPSKRKLNDRQAFYIPRAHRPDLPRHKGRYAKEYFP